MLGDRGLQEVGFRNSTAGCSTCTNSPLNGAGGLAGDSMFSKGVR